MKEKLLNKYKIIETNNTGGFGIIYKVVDEEENVYALKKLSVQLSEEKINKLLEDGYVSKNEIIEFSKSQINNEIETLKKFNSDYIIKLYDVIIDKDDYYLKLEYVEDIKTFFKDKQISEEDVIKISLDMCEALLELEKKDIVHGDIKPGNIFVGENNYKLGDFGSACISGSKSSNVYATLNYVSPEVYKKEKIDFRADQYSLGIVMYYLLSGNLPFVSDNIPLKDAFEIRMNESIIPEIFDVQNELMGIVLKACSYNKKDRFKNISDMKEALQKILPKENYIKEIDFVPSENETTLSIYDEKLVSSQPKKNVNENKKSNKKIKISFKKVLLILILLMIPCFLFMHYSLTKTCKVGYVNKNGFCVKGNYYCPDGYVLNERKKCQKTIESIDAKVSYTCKSGYTLAGDLCVSDDVKEVVYKYECLDGFTLKGEKCEKVESVDAVATYKCPSGYISSGDQCVTVSNVPATKSYACDDSSYTMSGNTCTKTISKTSEPTQKYTCSSGGVLKGTMCEYTESPQNMWFYTPSCTKGTYNYRDMKCHYTESAKLSYTCNEGILSSDGSCVYKTTETKPATLKFVCPSGYASIGSECAKTTGMAATVKYICPDSATLKGKKCYTTISTDAVGMYSCPDGYVASGVNCYREEFLQAVKKYTCSRVYTLNGGKCEKYEVISAKIKYD